MLSFNGLFKKHKQGNAPVDVNAALLSETDILDLRHRTQQRLSPLTHPYEVAHRQIGEMRSPYRGSGLDYEESRAYQYGDELRYVNWRLTARTGDMMMKVFKEERRPTVFILMDRRAGMRFGTRQRLKVSQAARAATIAAFAGQLRNMSVSALLLDEDFYWLDSRNGEQAIFDLINSMCAACPPQFSTPAAGNKPVTLSNALANLCQVLTPGTILYLISDFADLYHTQRAQLLQLAAQHSVQAIHIADPAEEKLPLAGKLNLFDPQMTAHEMLDTANQALRKQYEKSSREFFQQRADLFHLVNIPYRKIATTCERIEDEMLPAQSIR